MSKFCMQCGAQIDDNAEICSSCGAAQTSTSAGDAVAVNGDSKKSKAIVIAVAAVVVVIVLLLLKALLGGGYKSPIDNVLKGMETGKGKYIYKAVPEFILEEEYDDMKKSEIIDELDDYVGDYLDNLEDRYGDDIKISYKIKSKEKIDKDDLEDLEDDLNDEYDGKIKVSKGYEIKARVTIKGDDDEDSNTNKFKVYKINGDWCVLDF